MIMRNLIILLLLAIVVVAVVRSDDVGSNRKSANKFINVALKSNWDSTPLHLEARHALNEDIKSITISESRYYFDIYFILQ